MGRLVLPEDRPGGPGAGVEVSKPGLFAAPAPCSSVSEVLGHKKRAEAATVLRPPRRVLMISYLSKDSCLDKASDLVSIRLEAITFAVIIVAYLFEIYVNII
jgi:hypothetical protein